MSIFLSALAFAILTLAFPLPPASVLTAAYVSNLQFPLPRTAPAHRAVGDEDRWRVFPLLPSSPLYCGLRLWSFWPRVCALIGRTAPASPSSCTGSWTLHAVEVLWHCLGWLHCRLLSAGPSPSHVQLGTASLPPLQSSGWSQFSAMSLPNSNGRVTQEWARPGWYPSNHLCVQV